VDKDAEACRANGLLEVYDVSAIDLKSKVQIVIAVMAEELADKIATVNTTTLRVRASADIESDCVCASVSGCVVVSGSVTGSVTASVSGCVSKICEVSTSSVS